MRIFEYTCREPGLWRGWLRNGQAVEISTNRSGWDFGGGIHIHGNGDDSGDRMIFAKIWRLTIIIPLGVVDHPWPALEGPQWSAYASSEFGLTFHWGLRRKQYDWPWTRHVLAYQKQMPDGTWRDVSDFVAEPQSETVPYTYHLRSGEVQHRKATVSKRRFVLCRRAFKAIGWPRWIEESIDVEFNEEVGERTGSWKGGTIGCGWDILPGETAVQALRRMERERKF